MVFVVAHNCLCNLPLDVHTHTHTHTHIFSTRCRIFWQHYTQRLILYAYFVAATSRIENM